MQLTEAFWEDRMWILADFSTILQPSPGGQISGFPEGRIACMILGSEAEGSSEGDQSYWFTRQMHPSCDLRQQALQQALQQSTLIFARDLGEKKQMILVLPTLTRPYIL